MHAVIQRVTEASVTVDGQIISKIGPGLLCLIGIKDTDTTTDIDLIAKRLLSIRVWPDEEDQRKGWSKSVLDKNYQILCVSQFTLCGRIQKGSKPDFSKAMKPGEAMQVYNALLDRLKLGLGGDKVFDGVFGAMMSVSLVNDGPVTFTISSDER
jgi:D-tyrosyl-tRNA(Tyr) deacylase